MRPSTKLLLDILMGAVIPIAVLNYLTQPLGPPVAYVVAALVPVTWIAIDLLAITRRFNVITGYVGLSAILNGLLAFWFVDGVLFALKDTAGHLVTVLLFGGSLLVGQPFFRFFFAQVVNPDTPDRQAALADLLAESGVRRALVLATLVIVVEAGLLGIINFVLNLNTVVAPFGSEAFNLQVAQVNAITRLAFPIPALLAFGLGTWLIYREVYRLLPGEAGKAKLDSDFWTLLALREAQRSR